MTDSLEKMRREWNRRAVENAKRNIAAENWQSEEAFDDSGRRATEILLRDLPLDNTKDETALDIGCGIGRMEKSLSPLFKQVYGVDISEEMIKRAQKRFRNYENVEFQVCNGKDLGIFKNNTFDFVFSVSTFQHCPGIVVWSYCNETHRVLKSKGLFKFQVFEKKVSIKEAVGQLIRGNIRRCFQSLLPITDPDDLWVIETYPEGKKYKRRELQKKLREIGFVQIEISVLKEKNRCMYWVTCRKL